MQHCTVLYLTICIISCETEVCYKIQQRYFISGVLALGLQFCLHNGLLVFNPTMIHLFHRRTVQLTARKYFIGQKYIVHILKCM